MAISRLSKAVGKAGKGKLVTSKDAVKVRKVGPISTLDMGKFQSLRSVPVEQRKSHLNLLEKINSFNQLRISPDIKLGITQNLLKSPDMPPTPVQKVAIKALSKAFHEHTSVPRSWLIAAETGSGKTLSYLAPLLSSFSEPTKSGIQTMVLVPTLELANQVGQAIQSIAPLGLKYMISAGSASYTSELARKASRGLDVVVSTPDKILKLMKTSPRLFEQCSKVVVDEADSLFNRSFAESTQSVVKQCPELSDAVFVSATIPRFFDKYLREHWPETTRLVTPSIHRLPRHIEFKVIEAWRRPYNDKKDLALQQALYAIYHDNSEPENTKRVLVFVNKKQDIQPCVEMLNKAGFDTEAVDRESDNLGQFVKPASPKSKTGIMKVLVSTDLVARGVDFYKIRNVILYDMPPSAADLIHRAGRTGRLGTKGRVLLIVNKRESSGWVRGLEKIVKKGMALA